MSTEVLFVAILLTVMGLLVITAFVMFFIDDHKRFLLEQNKMKDVEQEYRDQLGEFADIDSSQMNTEIESQMSFDKRQKWLKYQEIKSTHKTINKFSLDLFGPAPLKVRVIKFLKFLGILAGFGIVYTVCLAIDDALGPTRSTGNSNSASFSFIIAVGALILLAVVRAGLRHHRDNPRTRGKLV